MKVFVLFFLFLSPTLQAEDVEQHWVDNLFTFAETSQARAQIGEALAHINQQISQGRVLSQTLRVTVLNRIAHLAQDTSLSDEQRLRAYSIMGAYGNDFQGAQFTNTLRDIANGTLDAEVFNAIVAGAARTQLSSSRTYARRQESSLALILNYLQVGADGANLRSRLRELSPENQGRVFNEIRYNLSHNPAFEDPNEVYSQGEAAVPRVAHYLRLLNSLDPMAIRQSNPNTTINDFYDQLTTLISHIYVNIDPSQEGFEEIRDLISLLTTNQAYQPDLNERLSIHRKSALSTNFFSQTPDCTDTRLDSEQGNIWATSESTSPTDTDASFETPLGSYGALNQGPDGYCYAFSSNVMYDSLLQSLAPRQYNQRRSSPLFAALRGAAHVTRTGTRTDGRRRRETLDGGQFCHVLEGLLESGSCPLEQMISPIESRDLDQFVTGLRRLYYDLSVYFRRGTGFVIPENRQEFCYRTYQAIERNLEDSPEFLSQFPRAGELIGNIIEIMSEIVPQVAGTSNLDERHQLQFQFGARFLSMKCEEENFQSEQSLLQGLSCLEFPNSQFPTSDFRSMLRDRIRGSLRNPLTPLPVGISYCSTFFRRGPAYQNVSDQGDILDEEDCGHHSSVIVGMRNRGGRCEYLIQNSWGTRCTSYRESLRSQCEDGKVWVDEDNLFDNTYKVQVVR